MNTERQAELRRDPRVLALVVALAMLGVASLYLVPLETLAPGMELPRAVFLVQPAILALLGSLAGWWAAPKAGLGAPVLAALVRGRTFGPQLRAALAPIGFAAVASAVILVAYVAWTVDIFADGPAADLPQPLPTRLLYGGLTEEVLVRWGVLSLLVVGLTVLGASRPASLRLANLGAALLFALGHFGLLFAIVPDPSAVLIAAVLFGNLVPGLLFGRLFIRHGLVAAMLAHAGTHLIAWIALGLLGLR